MSIYLSFQDYRLNQIYGITSANKIITTNTSSITSTFQLQQQQQQKQQPPLIAADTGLRRRLFAGFRPLSGLGRLRYRSAQHRSISLPESNYDYNCNFPSFFLFYIYVCVNNCVLYIFYIIENHLNKTF